MRLGKSFLSELDVYMAFAKISKDEQYCRPSLINSGSRKFDIKQGRHPVVMKLMGEEHQFVSNDISLNDTKRCLIVTGPNMGGKSTYIRQTALIALMAHMGCFVPADSATVPLFDGIYVRMGADDDIINKTSTFMTEMNEASSILSSATSKSLVIFDELGRGTSTNDGTAIAFATLEYLIKEIQCFSLFVTHYPTVLELRNYYPENISDVHMAYILKEIDDDDDIQTVTFLYNVVSGISEKSYGINVAALAGISKNILIEAQKKSKEMELQITVLRQLRNLLQYFKSQNSSIECSPASQLI